MKLEWMKVAIVSGALVLGLFAYKLTGKHDSAVEQVAESVLRAHGVDIDLSPDED